jgi:hypothetical protein
MLLYDHILTLDDEVRLVWAAKTTLPKLLFLISRYIVPTAMIIRMTGTDFFRWLSIYHIISHLNVQDFSGLARLMLSPNVSLYPCL